MERNDYTAFLSGTLLFASGLLVGAAAKGYAFRDTPKRIETIQEHNAQIYEELSSGYPDSKLGQLILNDETDTYEFRLASEGIEPMVCTGEYSVTDSVAEISGTIACTTTTEVAEVGGN